MHKKVIIVDPTVALTATKKLNKKLIPTPLIKRESTLLSNDISSQKFWEGLLGLRKQTIRGEKESDKPGQPLGHHYFQCRAHSAPIFSPLFCSYLTCFFFYD